MKLNKFLWNIYKESQSGKDLIAFFENYNNQLILCRNTEFYSKLRYSIAYAGTLDLDIEEHVTEINELYYGLLHDENNQLLTIEIQSMEDAELFFNDIYNLQFLDDKGNLNDNDCLSSDDIPVLSEVLYAVSPKYFFPYYSCRFRYPEINSQDAAYCV